MWVHECAQGCLGLARGAQADASWPPPQAGALLRSPLLSPGRGSHRSARAAPAETIAQIELGNNFL